MLETDTPGGWDGAAGGGCSGADWEQYAWPHDSYTYGTSPGQLSWLTAWPAELGCWVRLNEVKEPWPPQKFSHHAERVHEG